MVLYYLAFPFFVFFPRLGFFKLVQFYWYYSSKICLISLLSCFFFCCGFISYLFCFCVVSLSVILFLLHFFVSCFPLFIIRSYSFHLYFVVTNTVVERQLLRLGYPLKSELRREREREWGEGVRNNSRKTSKEGGHGRNERRFIWSGE